VFVSPVILLGGKGVRVSTPFINGRPPWGKGVRVSTPFINGCPPWGKGVRVSTPFINTFQKKKVWNLPKFSTNLGDFKTCFFSSSKCDDFKTLFFPSWKCGDLGFFLEIFQNARFTKGLFNGFSSQKINK
jgi:hypothetical protein